MLRRTSTVHLLLTLATFTASSSWCGSALWSGPEVTLLGSPSPDGKWLSFVNAANGALSVRDLATGTSRDIAVRGPKSAEFAYFSVFSRDAARIAYAWFNDKGFYELRVTSTDGKSEPRTLYRNELAGFVQPCAWTPDGANILTLLFRRDNISQIALIPAAGGPPRVLRSLNWVYPKRMDISSDGRWIVYDNFSTEGSDSRAIFLLSIEGSEEVRLTPDTGNYLFPLWSPKGHTVYFAGDNGGRQSIWSVDVKDGKAVTGPQLIAETQGRILPLGITSGRDLIYGVRTGETDVFMGSGGEPVPSRFKGRNSAPALSADGRRIAYLSRRGTENFGQDARVIVVQDLASADEREIAASMAFIERVTWPPTSAANPSRLLVSGSDGKGRGGLFLVDLASGATHPFAAEPGGPAKGFEAAWSKDGKSVYYLHGEGELRERRVDDGNEVTLLQAASMKGLALNPAGDTLAIGIAGNAIRLTPLDKNSSARLLPFAGLTNLIWPDELLASRGPDLFAIAPDGSAPRRVERPGGFVFAAGRELSEVHTLHLP